MIDLSNGRELGIAKNQLRRSLSGEMRIDAAIEAWDLTQLDTMLTIDSLADDEKRKKIIASQRKKNNIGLGALVGGIIDASSGEDSIVDGVLLGAAFGAVCSSSASNPRAQVGLLFKDGSHVSVDVDKNEYTQLQTQVASNKLNNVGFSSPACIKRPLTRDEIDYILDARSSNALLLGLAVVFLLMLAPSLMINVFFPSMNYLVDMDRIQTLAGIFLSIVAVFIVVKNSVNMTNKENLLRDHEEKIFYHSLNVSR